jgi:hypothetical protein
MAVTLDRTLNGAISAAYMKGRRKKPIGKKKSAVKKKRMDAEAAPLLSG